jgi:hypothetical protein
MKGDDKMGERYYITGVQIGMVLAFLENDYKVRIHEILNEIQEKQFIGHADEDDKIAIIKAKPLES